MNATRLLLVLSLPLVLSAIGCAHDRQSEQSTADRTSGDDRPRDQATANRSSDDERTERARVVTRDTDRDGTDHTVAVDDTGPTAMDQSESAADVEITRQIRSAVVGDSSLSFGARNCVIITNGGHVTLRGDVTRAESAAIERHARAASGVVRVDNRLDTTDQATR